MKEMLEAQAQTLSKHDWEWIKITREELNGPINQTLIAQLEPPKTQNLSRSKYISAWTILLIIMGIEI